MKKLFELAIVVFGTCCVRADFIVVPNDRATQSGNGANASGFDGSGTFQTVYGSKDFSGPVLITAMAFRMDEASGGLSFDAVIPRITVRISTYSGNFASFNRFSYEANKGPDDTTVFDSSVHWTTTDLPGAGPNPFDLKIQFSKAFLYDPGNGFLLLNYDATGPFTGGTIADAHAHGDLSIGWTGASAGNLVTQFEVISVPEPREIFLIGLGLAAIWGRKLRV